MTRMPSLKLVNATRPGSMRKSFLGSRPQSTYLLGDEAMASSTTCGGMRTMRVSRSTRAAAVLEDVARVVRLDEHAGALEHLERREMDVVELGLGEHVDAQPAAARAAGVQVPLHTAPPWPQPGALLEARHAVDGHVQHLGDVELRLHGAGVRGVRELLHRDAAEAEVAAHVVHGDRVGEVGDGAAELVRHVGLGLLEAHAPGHLHAGHQISGGPHPAHARGQRVRARHAERVARRPPTSRRS